MAGMFEQIKQLTQMRREGKRIQAEIQRVTATYTNGGISATARGDFNITALTITDEALEELKAGKTARFVKNFLAGRDSVEAACAAYVEEVKNGTFPAAEHSY